MTRIRAGFTLLEMLIVVGIIGILLAIGIPMLRPPSAYLFANDLKAMIQQSRYEAIKRNIPVALVWNSGTQAFTAQLSDASFTCNGTTVLSTKKLTDYRLISVQVAFLQNGVVWLPSGLGAQCGGGLMSNSTTVTDGKARFKVVTSSAGRVRLEKL